MPKYLTLEMIKENFLVKLDVLTIKKFLFNLGLNVKNEMVNSEVSKKLLKITL